MQHENYFSTMMSSTPIIVLVEKALKICTTAEVTEPCLILLGSRVRCWTMSNLNKFALYSQCHEFHLWIKTPFIRQRVYIVESETTSFPLTHFGVLSFAYNVGFYSAFINMLKTHSYKQNSTDFKSKYCKLPSNIVNWDSNSPSFVLGDIKLLWHLTNH